MARAARFLSAVCSSVYACPSRKIYGFVSEKVTHDHLWPLIIRQDCFGIRAVRRFPSYLPISAPRIADSSISWIFYDSVNWEYDLARLSLPVVIQHHKERWQTEFKVAGEKLRSMLSDLTERLDHIGSTSVYGLASKMGSTSKSPSGIFRI